MGCAIASYCCGTHVLFQSVANMAARRSGSLLIQRCIFCSRETLKRRLDSDMRHFSRIRNALFVASCRGGIFFASGKKQLIPLAQPYNIFNVKTNEFSFSTRLYFQHQLGRLTLHFLGLFLVTDGNFTHQVSQIIEISAPINDQYVSSTCCVKLRKINIEIRVYIIFCRLMHLC